MKFQLKYGKGTVSFHMKKQHYLGTIVANQITHELLDEEAVKNAMEHPIGSRKLYNIVRPGERIVIVTSDITRPMPSHKVLPLVLAELTKARIPKKDITVVLALGSHRAHTEEEKRALVGDIVYESGIEIIDSSMDNCRRLGVCKNGTPADIFEPVADADRIICLGNIEFHYFAGYSGGSKALMPGVSSHDAIQANHSNMIRGGAFAGNMEGNPVRQDIDEIVKFISIDFIVNVVLDEKKAIVKAFAGDVFDAHRAGCGYLDEMYKIRIRKKADIVIVSPGGFPKDINIYQAQKGLDNSKHAVKEGGIIIWCASASEGFGERIFEEWMTTMTPPQMIKEIKENFKLGGHKAAAIAMMMEKFQIFMVSGFDTDLVKKMGFIPYDSVQEAIDAALLIKGSKSKVLIMPQGGSTLPTL